MEIVVDRDRIHEVRYRTGIGGTKVITEEDEGRERDGRDQSEGSRCRHETARPICETPNPQPCTATWRHVGLREFHVLEIAADAWSAKGAEVRATA